MSTLVIETTDPDYWPCPQACGGPTEDPYGGPCSACWRTLTVGRHADPDDELTTSFDRAVDPQPKED